MSAIDLLIIGGGPAGMSAALAAASAGVSSTLVDEAPALGGQIYRKGVGAAAHAEATEGDRLRAAVAAHGERITVLSEAAAFGIFGDRQVGILEGGAARVVEAKAIVLATGAHEYVTPFPGWTLPGVMTPGAGQILAKGAGIAPGRRVLVAGTGPFLLVVALALVKAGAQVVGVLEASPRRPWLTLPLKAPRSLGILGEGVGYLRALGKAGVPMRYGRMVCAAEGDGVLQRVIHAPADADWQPDRGRAEAVDVDTLCVGYGFIPRIYLAQLAGCALDFSKEVGGWIPRRDPDMRTTADGIYAAGDGAGVAGALVAGLEGRLAGLAAAHQLGALSASALATQRREIDAGLSRLTGLRRALDAISAPRPGLHSLVDDDTIVCRCEEVRWRDARRSIEFGGTSFRTMKVQTRLGMGPCQARFCWPAMSRHIAHACGQPPEEVGPASPRPPLVPLTLGQLAAAVRS